MSEIITTLHKKDDATVDVYPNIKADNIPSGAITTAKMGFHLYEHNINLFNSITPATSDMICSFSFLSTSNTPYTIDNIDEIANLLHTRGFTGIDTMLKASGRCYEDSFRVVTEVNFGEQSDNNDYCETLIVGVYGDNADTLYYVYNTLSENEHTKLNTKEYEASLIRDVVVTLF